MARWNADTGTVERWPPGRHPEHPGWLTIDCGCCNGIAWSCGETPDECSDCGGGGFLWLHIASGSVARWPGGPFTGARLTREQIERLLAAADTPTNEGA